MRCEELVTKKCPCGKSKIRVECYKINYPDHKRQLYMTQEEIDDLDNFKCKKVCN